MRVKAALDAPAARRWVAIATLLVLVAAEVALLVRPAKALQGNTIQYDVTKPVSVDEPSALVPDPVTHIDLRTLPSTCALLPTCELFLLELHYPANADPHTNYFTTITATLHGLADYQLEVFADPLGAQSEVSNNTSTGRILHVHMITSPLDPDQEYGITMYLVQGTVTPFTLSISSSTQSFPNPFESLNPVPTIPTIPPPTPTVAPTTLPPPPSTPPPVTTATPPPTAAPDQGLAASFTDNGQFTQGLAAPAAPLFKKTAVVGPPGKPSTLQLWLALLALPVVILCLFPILVRRRRDRGLL
jgi:hypothetical protein